jgi:HlyD family secretion protein
MKRLFQALVLLALGAAGTAVAVGALRFSHDATVYRTEKVKRDNIRATVTATGTLEPEELVDVGAQVAGKIMRLGQVAAPAPVVAQWAAFILSTGPGFSQGACLPSVGAVPAVTVLGAADSAVAGKTLDWCSRVVKDTLLAEIDPALYRARLTQAEANLIQAEANVEQTDAKLRQYERDWRRAQTMHAAKAIGDSDYDAARSNYETTRASLGVARAQVNVCQAALEEARANLGYTRIVSPVDGVIIDRRVNIGQTVIASLNAPSLFLIAKDLRRMEIWASVNEADIGQIRKGQEVTFTVPAYPQEKFKGEVGQIRMNAAMNSSVVTYTVVVRFTNEQEKLLPYLTASLQFEVEQRKQVLALPNAVLRWRPQPAQVAPQYRAEWAPRLRRRNPEGDKPRSARDSQERLTVWLADGQGFVVPREIQVGLTDGLSTEVLAGLEDGAEVVSGVERVTDTSRGVFLEGFGKMKQGNP